MLATIIGLGVAIWTFGATGFAEVAAIVGRIGIGGFLIFLAWSIFVFGLLGAAWLAATPGEPWRRVTLFAWARMVREGASDLLPFSQLGGIILGTRVVANAGVPTSRVYAALVVDLTTEMAGQLVFTLFGLAMMASLLAGASAASALRPMILGGTGFMIVAILAFFFAQRSAINLTERIAGHFLPGSAEVIGGIHAELTNIYSRRRRVLAAFAFNLMSWTGSAFGAWLVLRLMGVPVSVWTVLSLESLIFTLRSIAFMIPGALGVQEATYMLAGPLFGLPPDVSLALSLAKRARDVTIGLPTLLVWQLLEARATAKAALSRTAG